MKCLQELEGSQRWPLDKILEIQNQRLRRLISHAYENVPYYYRLMNERNLKACDINRSVDLVKLPVLTKQLIRRNFNDVTARDFPERETIHACTGGSSGEPFIFHSTREDQYSRGYARSLRARRWYGYRIGDRSVWFHNRPPYISLLHEARRVFIRFFERELEFDVHKISTDNIALYAKRLEKFKPNLIHGFPSAIYLLAQCIEKEGKPGLRPRIIITGGEQLYDYQKELFKTVFKCDTYSSYSSWEMHSIADECVEHTGFHIAAENAIVEVVDGEGKPVPAGVEGRILITNLHNYAMPLIRYDIGDI